MNFVTIIVCLVLAALIALALTHLLRQRSSGRHCCGCDACANCSDCRKQEHSA